MNLLYIKLILGATILATLGLMAWKWHDSIYQNGYSAAEVKFKQQINDYNDLLKTKIITLEQNSVDITNMLHDSQNKAKDDYKNIIKEIKNKPLYTVNNITGVCSPSESFVVLYNEAIDRTNKK